MDDATMLTAETLAAADSCARCGYDLRGADDDAACPECGLIAERSRRIRREHGHLADASPGWLRGIAVGTWLILLAHVAAVAWPFALGAIGNALGPRGFADLAVAPLREADVAVAGWDLAIVLLVAGVWLLTRPQHAAASDRRLRRGLRLAALAPAVAAILFHASAGPLMRSTTVPLPLWIAGALMTVGLAPLPALMFTLLRRMAQRVLDSGLAEHAAIVGVGLSLTLLSVPALIYAANHLGDGTYDRTVRRNLELLGPLVLMVSFFLFGGWSGLNCIRFALAFGNAARQSRRTWTDADRATG